MLLKIKTVLICFSVKYFSSVMLVTVFVIFDGSGSVSEYCKKHFSRVSSRQSIATIGTRCRLENDTLPPDIANTLLEIIQTPNYLVLFVGLLCSKVY